MKLHHSKFELIEMRNRQSNSAKIRLASKKELTGRMRQLRPMLFVSILFVLAVCVSAAGQSQTFTDDNVDYKLELPSNWQVVTRPDGLQRRAEFIYGDRLAGYLQVYKETVEPGVTPAGLAAANEDEKLRFKPGYVDGKDEKFTGHLDGLTVSYEFTYAGKPMAGRIYYLQADNRTIYVLHFTGLRDKLVHIRNQTDSIARSFTVK